MSCLGIWGLGSLWHANCMDYSQCPARTIVEPYRVGWPYAGRGCARTGDGVTLKFHSWERLLGYALWGSAPFSRFAGVLLCGLSVIRPT